ncbi:hypothetical protein GCM10009557_15520 [Virgisporangium ochraceum]|uniref:Uncharacterized protein n=1 Tax=Virgisporangium ochraceum TaxID=65505 RepID=A0A8J4EAQ9_9ACTN|nr:hypothetical protein [Virgisporangium ochraceum]GIJ67946.1 hypothetical protein Voc01_028630 [Virgisporangium ochraceum]
MNVISYTRGTTDELATALAGDPGAPSHLAERTLVAADGYWQPGDWRTDVRAVIAARHPLGAVGVRTDSTEPTLTSREWAGIARHLVTAIGWRDSPWVAVRTSPQSMVLLASSPQRPEPVELQRVAGVIRRRYGLADHRPRPAAPDGTPRPMAILDAHHTDHGQLAVLVDRIPDVSELQFTEHELRIGLPVLRHPPPRYVYLGTHPDGYVLDLFDNGDGRGSNGEPFDLHLTDGTVRTIVGPYSSANAVSVTAHLPEVFLGRISLHDDPARFHAYPTSGTAALLTNTAAQRALLIAARQITRPHPAATAATSYPPGQAVPGKPGPADAAPPSPPGTPRRHAR